MDHERRIRFLLPPFFLIASLLLGMHFTEVGLVETLKNMKIGLTPENLIAIFAGGSVIILSLGFLIGTFTYMFLRFIYLFIPGKIHEAAFNQDTLRSMASYIGIGNPHENNKYDYTKHTLYIAAAFDHGYLPEGIHRWIIRRWNAFNVGTSSSMAVLLSIPFGNTIFKIPLNREWLISCIVVALLLAGAGTIAWCETKHMIEFLAKNKIGQKNESK